MGEFAMRSGENHPMERERRKDRRLAIRLPLEYYPVNLDSTRAVHTVTRNISTGGVYFEVDVLDDMSVPEVDSDLRVELTVPPGDGYFPYEGRVISVARVLRCSELRPTSRELDMPARIGIGARLSDPLKLAF